MSKFARLLIGAIVAPGAAPFVADYLAGYGIISIPSDATSHIFSRLLLLFYISNVPSFLVIRYFGGGWKKYTLAGIAFPIILLGALLILTPIQTEDEFSTNLAIFKYGASWAILFGILSGILFWIITEKFEGRERE